MGVSDTAAVPVERLAACGARHQALRLLVLFGSRARADARPESDWDFGYLAGPGFDQDALLLDLVDELGMDRIDLVDLARAGILVAYRAAADGRALYEATPGIFERFWIDAVTFWCDIEPILRVGYADALARLRR